MSYPSSSQLSSNSNRQAATYTNTSGSFQGQGQQQNAPSPNVVIPSVQNRSPLDPGYVWPIQSTADSDDSTTLPDHLAQTLRALRELINAIKPPLIPQLDAVVAVFASLKGDESEIKKVLTHYPHSALLVQCQSSLSRLMAALSAAIHASDPARRLTPTSLSKQQIQTLCQGLAVCVPVTGKQLLKSDSKAPLQSLTDTLLTGAMAQGLPEAVEANGEVFDILNWVSRGLKAGLLESSEPIKRCFEQSLVLFDEWTRGDQSRQLLSGHNLGRCAVQISTLLNHTGVDLQAASPVTRPPPPEQPKQVPEAPRALTYGELVQRCVRQLCAPTLLGRLTSATDETVSLSNICNTVKDAIDKRVLTVADPKLLPSLNELVKVIGKLSHAELIGNDGSCRSLSNFSNFLRTLAEYADKDPALSAQVLPMLEATCGHLIGCINGEGFTYAAPDSQPLTNLISFIKFCDKMLERRSKADSLGTTTTASSTATTSSSSTSSTATTLTLAALRAAAQLLIDGVLWYKASVFHNPAAQGGLLAGLAYLWQRNLVTVTSAMQQFVLDLLTEIGNTGKKWQDESRRTMLPALAALMALDLVTLEQAQPALQRLLRPADNAMPVMAEEIGREMKRLNVIEEKVTALAASSSETPVTASTTTAGTSATTVTTTATSKTTTTTTFSKLPATLAQTQKKQETKPPITPSSSGNTPARAKTTSAVTSKERRNEATKTTMSTKAPAVAFDHCSPQVNVRPNAKIASLPTTSNQESKGVPSQARPKPENTLTKEQPAIKTAASDKAPVKPVPPSTNEQKQRQEKAKASVNKQQKEKPAASKGKSKAVPMNRQTTLSQAIANGKVKDVGQKLGQQATWSDKEIVAVLDAVMNQITLIDKDIIGALDAFFNAVKTARQEAGTAVLRSYFLAHPNNFAGLQNLLVSQNLVTVKLSLQAVETQDQLLEYIDSLSEIEWNEGEEKTKVMNHWKKKLQDSANALRAPIQNNRPRAVERLLQLPFVESVVLKKNDGTPTIMEFIEKGQLSLAKMLLATPEGVRQAHASTHDGVNALMIAAQNGHVEIVKLLLDTPTAAEQTKAVVEDGTNALIVAARSGHMEIVQLLLATPTAAEQTKAVDKDSANALIFAAQNGHVEIVKLLLATLTAEEQTKAVVEDGTNALMVAAQSGHVEIVELLLATSTAAEQTKAITKDGVNALMVAAQSGHVEIVKMLLATSTAAEQTKAVNKNGVNALIVAAKNGHFEIVKMLLAMPTAAEQAKSVTNYGDNALVEATRRRRADIVTLLLETDFDGQQANAIEYVFGVNALMIASEMGNVDIFKQLLASPTGAEQAKTVAKDGTTALMDAAQYGHVEIVKLLLDTLTGDEQMKMESKNGHNTLAAAVKNGHVEVVQLLLATPTYAEKYTQEKIAEFLQEATRQRKIKKGIGEN